MLLPREEIQENKGVSKGESLGEPRSNQHLSTRLRCCITWSPGVACRHLQQDMSPTRTVIPRHCLCRAAFPQEHGTHCAHPSQGSSGPSGLFSHVCTPKSAFPGWASLALLVMGLPHPAEIGHPQEWSVMFCFCVGLPQGTGRSYFSILVRAPPWGTLCRYLTAGAVLDPCSSPVPAQTSCLWKYCLCWRVEF